MNHSKTIKALVFILPILWMGCNDQDETNSSLPLDFVNGVFITNEGNFGEGDGSLSYYDFEKDIVFNNVYSEANGGKALGDVVQSIISNSDLGGMIFVIVNNSNKVEALLSSTLESSYTIDLKLPRYMVNNDKLYVSEWVSFSEQGRVSVIDPMSGETLNTITTDFGAEGLIIAGSYLFVSNNFTTTVSVIDLNSEKVVETLDVGSSPGLMVVDADGDVWVVCAGGFDQDFNPAGDGKLVEIDPVMLSIKTEVALGMNVSTKIATSPSADRIYYFSGTTFYSFKVGDSGPPEAPLIRNDEAISFYGIGIDASGMIYLSDSKGFAENGEVLVYDSEGNLQNSFDVGRGPNGFLFK